MRFTVTHGLVAATLVLAACSAIAEPTEPTAAPPPGTSAAGAGTTAAPTGAGADAPGIETIDHFIFLVQENRSFDHYFGTYPSAKGIPRRPDGASGYACPTSSRAGSACGRT